MAQKNGNTVFFVILATIFCVCGCDNLGLRLGPRNLPPAKPIDQTNSAVVDSADTESPSAANVDTSNSVESPSDDAAVDVAKPSNAAEKLKPYKDWTFTETAIDALGRIGEAAVEPLVKSLDDPNPLVRYRAARILAKIGPDAFAAVPALVKHLSDVDESVRKEAARALGQIGPQAADAVPELIRALEHGTDEG
ncbi:MAG: HEAT repeat domain-containing protein [Planctomycetales bacterium]|nr:HEAT repeat domain-containing protein [Planctomycetales bacterium]